MSDNAANWEAALAAAPIIRKLLADELPLDPENDTRVLDALHELSLDVALHVIVVLLTLVTECGLMEDPDWHTYVWDMTELMEQHSEMRLREGGV
jgi:hypothetical protein